MSCRLAAGCTILVSLEGVTARKVFQGCVCVCVCVQYYLKGAGPTAATYGATYPFYQNSHGILPARHLGVQVRPAFGLILDDFTHRTASPLLYAGSTTRVLQVIGCAPRSSTGVATCPKKKIRKN